MFTRLHQLLSHRIMMSLVFTETGGVHTLRLRTAWLVFAALFTVSGWLGMMLAGDIARAKFTATITGNTEVKYYLDMISELRGQRDAEREQMKTIAQQLGILQARLDRFDALGNKLKAEGAIVTGTDDGEGIDDFEEGTEDRPGTVRNGTSMNGKGGPELSGPNDPSLPDLQSLQQQVNVLTDKADLAEIALETSLALAIRKSMGPAAGGGIPYLWPMLTATYRLTSPFGWRSDPIHGTRAWHAGMDMADHVGSPVTSAADGIVTYAGWRMGYGTLVEIKHENGFSTRYGHLSKALVKEGDRVNAGDLVALSGNSGRSTGPHLHFEVRKDGNPLNPLAFIKDTRSEVMQQAKAGHGNDLVARWRKSGSTRAAQK
jgi:murein DD-endopeptidase MepM/ murein hydrolase activator NlpD